MYRTRQYFLRFTNVSLSNSHELRDNLLRVKIYLDLHLILYLKNRESIDHDSLDDDTVDEGPIVFSYAEVPEIMLEILQQSLVSDTYTATSELKSLPYLALCFLSNLFFLYSNTFLLVPERLFRESEKTIVKLADAAFHNKFVWYDRLSFIPFFGIGSSSRACIWFLHRHMDIVGSLFRHVYHGMEIVEDKLKNNEINSQDKSLYRFLTMFRGDQDLALSVRYLGVYVTNHAAACFRNVMESTKTNYDLFHAVSKEVMKSKIIEHFPYIVKNLITWFVPGLYLGLFLAGVASCLNIAGVVEALVLHDLSQALDHKQPLGVETFRFWNHENQFPNTVAWLLLHSFSMDKKMAYDQCICILCHVLEKSEDSIVNVVVEHFGQDLMDLAHLVEISYPAKTNVQSIVLEALFRHAHIQHKVYGCCETVEGMPEYLVSLWVWLVMFCTPPLCCDVLLLLLRHVLFVSHCNKFCLLLLCLSTSTV